MIKLKSQNKFATAGFTLVEMLVTLSIFLIMTSILLTKNSEFNSNILLTNLAYETAIAIRQAQFSSITVKQSGDTGTTDDFGLGYGIYFNISKPDTFVYFADKFITGQNHGDYFYAGKNDLNSCNLSSECLQIYNIGKGNKIKKMCVTDYSSQMKCSDTGGLVDINIVFVRPNPDATITAEDNSGLAQTYSSAQVYFTTTQGDKESWVKISSTGQVSVNN